MTKTILFWGLCFVNVICQAQITPLTISPHVLSHGKTVNQLGKSIDCIFQDHNNIYWFASNGEGVYSYNGRQLLHFTEEDGLCSNFVWSVQEDVNGNIWFSTRDGFCFYNGEYFTNYTTIIHQAPFGKLNYKAGGLFFNHSDGLCFFDGESFTNFRITPDNYQAPSSSLYRPYGVYCAVADSSGKVWFGTQEKGVCVYDGSTFSFINGKDLDGPAVRCILQDSKGILWFGNNGGGLFRYDGIQLRNLSEEQNLGNFEFLKLQRPVDKAGSLARAFALNEDKNGTLWIGTVDSGIWAYDGTNLKNYTAQVELATSSVNVIYKDHYGELWFVVNGENIYHFNGKTFVQVKIGS